MRTAVVGAGAIGAYVAGRLAEAGAEVLLVGRPDQVRAVRAEGLRIREGGTCRTVVLPAAERMDGAYDLVVFAVKTQDLEQAYQDNHVHLETGQILTTQNGVQADNILSTHFERDQMIGSIVMFGTTYTTPGEVTVNFPGGWIMGRPFAPNDIVLAEVADSLRKAFDVTVTDEIMGMKWLKVFVNLNNALPALLGRPMQETFAEPVMCRLAVRLLKEGVEIVTAAGINLVSLPEFPVERITGLTAMPSDRAAGILQKTLTGLSREPVYGSVLQSLLRGRATEIDFINGELVQLARAIGRRAPLNERIVDMVHEVERTGGFFPREEIEKRTAGL